MPLHEISSAVGIPTKIFDRTLGAAAASIDTGASSIPTTYDTLWVYVIARGDTAATQVGLAFTVNNDTGSNYDIEYNRAANTTSSALNTRGSTNWLLTMTGSTATANVFAQIDMRFFAYSQTTAFKTFSGLNGITETTAATCLQDTVSGTYRSTTAISRLAIAASSGNLIAGTRLVIYGL